MVAMSRTLPAPLAHQEIEKALAELPGWACESDALTKEFVFPSFRDALAWMVRAGFEAEALDHHPEWTNIYRTVRVRLNTHSAGGRVTALDVELATRLERLAGGTSALKDRA
jgi:4a-hydroxytetrahydrobiopterin dehydratase